MRTSLVPLRSETARQLLRFVVVGGVNTLLTYALLLALLLVMDARIAYTISFLTGVAFNALLTGQLVFGSRPTRERRAAYAGWLCLVYLAGLLTTHAAVLLRVEPPALVAALPLIVSAPLNFVGGRLIFTGSATQTERVPS